MFSYGIYPRNIHVKFGGLYPAGNILGFWHRLHFLPVDMFGCFVEI